MLNWFRRRKRRREDKKALKEVKAQVSADTGTWFKCEGCRENVYSEEIGRNLNVCPRCDYHYPISIHERIRLAMDPETFVAHDEGLRPVDGLGFKDSRRYKSRLREGRKSSGQSEAVISGMGSVNGFMVSMGIFEFGFMEGSLGAVAGEKVVRIFERAKGKKCPALIFISSSGARVQEGIYALMQGAKIAAARRDLRELGMPFIAVLVNPVFGGAAANLGMMADIVLAEPRARIGYAGRKQFGSGKGEKFPEDFQSAEWVLEHGGVDAIVHRKELKERLAVLLKWSK